MVSHDILRRPSCFLLKPDRSTVPSSGYSGVASLSRDSLWFRDLPLLLASVITNCPPFVVYSGVLSSLLLLCARLGALPLGGPAAAWSSIGKRRSACCCALCAARTSRNPSIKLATNLACANPASPVWHLLPSFCELGGYNFLCRRSGRLYGSHGRAWISVGTAWVVDLSLVMHVHLALIRERNMPVITLKQVGNRGVGGQPPCLGC